MLDRAGLKEGAVALSFDSYDNADTESLTLDQARLPDVIVAYSMLGAPITTEHGGPVRLYVAPMFGYKSLKWLSGIRVVDQVEPGFWEQNGYPVDGWIDGSTDTCRRQQRHDVARQWLAPRSQRRPPRAGRRLLRFDRVERFAHWANALLFGILMATALPLYFVQIEQFIGRRTLVEEIHLWAGLMLPVPLLVSLAGPWGSAPSPRPPPLLAVDPGRAALARGRSGRKRLAEPDKFNPGQKLNALFVGGAIVVMLGSGCDPQMVQPLPPRLEDGGDLRPRRAGARRSSSSSPATS